MRVDLFDYALPVERIAQEPRPRGESRLLVLNREGSGIAHRRFADLPNLLREGDVLVRNDVRVRPARLYGRDAEDRLVEIFLLRQESPDERRWSALAKPGAASADQFLAFAAKLASPMAAITLLAVSLPRRRETLRPAESSVYFTSVIIRPAYISLPPSSAEQLALIAEFPVISTVLPTTRMQSPDPDMVEFPA